MTSNNRVFNICSFTWLLGYNNKLQGD